MPLRRALVYSFIAASSSAAFISSAAQRHNLPETCVLQNKTYVCNIYSLRHALARASTVSLETDPRDRATEDHLAALAASLHKQVVPRGEGDLTLALHPLGNNGFVLGPGGSDLARLDVYAPGRELLWSETYNGDPDRPWALTVDALVMQFEDHLKHAGR